MMQRPLPLGITGSVRLSPRVRQWLGLIAVTGAAQVAVQAIGFIGGILVIRMLPVHEYALYTLANTMLGTMVILADGGIATGVMAEGGKVWQDKAKLGAVLATGMALRKKFAVFSLLVAVPILLYLLRKHDASWLMSTLIVLSLVPAFFSSLTGRLFEIPLKLHQDINALQRYQVEANVGRLALLGLTMFAFPFAAVAILCAGASQVWNNIRVRRTSRQCAEFHRPVDPQAREKYPAHGKEPVARVNLLLHFRAVGPMAHLAVRLDCRRRTSRRLEPVLRGSDCPAIDGDDAAGAEIRPVRRELSLQPQDVRRHRAGLVPGRHRHRRRVRARAGPVAVDSRRRLRRLDDRPPIGSGGWLCPLRVRHYPSVAGGQGFGSAGQVVHLARHRQPVPDRLSAETS